MARCKRCGAAIEWMEMPSGKKMPVDLSEVAFVVMSGGKDYALIDEEYFEHGKIVGDAYEASRYELARPSHFCTCPARKEGN